MPLISRRWRLPAIILFVCLVALAMLSGPLFPFTPLPSDIAGVVAKAPDIDSYLSRSEAAHAGVKPGLAKTVIWNHPTARHKTPMSLVYIHGFSASRKDIAPVVESIAGTLGANAFLTRLAAHGRATSAEFATVTPQDWLNDAREALAIGRRIGDRVILIGTSTGALLVTMVAIEDNSPDMRPWCCCRRISRSETGGRDSSPDRSAACSRVSLSAKNIPSIPTVAATPNSGQLTTRRKRLSRSWTCSTMRVPFISARSRCRSSSSIPTGT